MAHDVFISYSSKDKTVADAACAVLENRGIRCWVAPRDIAAGSDWGESIIDAIAGSRVMVLVFSANANASPQVKREVERAVNKGVTVVPFRIENVPLCKTLEYFVSTPHWMDAYTEPLEQHLGKLAETVLAIVRTPGIEDGHAVPAAAKESVGERPFAMPAARPPRRGLPKAGVAAALAVGLSGAIVARTFLLPGAPAAQADSPAQPAVKIANEQTPTNSVPALPPATAPSTPDPKPVAITSQPTAAPEATSAPAPDDAQERALATSQARRLRVRSVVLIGDERYCVINGRPYEEGELVDGFRVDHITTSRVIVAKGKFRFELRPQADVDSRIVSRTNVDNGTRDDDRPGPQQQQQQQQQQQPPPPSNGGPTVFGPGPGGGPPGSAPPPPPPGPPGRRPIR